MDSRHLTDHDLCEPARLAIVCALARARDRQLPFGELARSLVLTDGNLACHLERLARVALVEVRRNGERGRASRTSVVLTKAGLDRLTRAAGELKDAARMIAAALGANASEPQSSSGPFGARSGQVARAPDPPAPSAEEYTIVDERFSHPD